MTSLTTPNYELLAEEFRVDACVNDDHTHHYEALRMQASAVESFMDDGDNVE